MKLNLSAKILLSILITTVIILSVGFHIIVSESKKDILLELEEEANIIGDMVQDKTTEAFEEIDNELFLLQQLVEQARLFEGIMWVEIFNKEAFVIAHSFKERVGKKPLPIHEEYVKEVMRSGKPISEKDKKRKRYNKFLPLKAMDDGKEQIIGVAEFVMTMNPGSLDHNKKIDAIAAILLPVAQGMLMEWQIASAYIQRMVEQLGQLANIREIEVLSSESIIIAHTKKKSIGMKPLPSHEIYINETLKTGNPVTEKNFKNNTYNRYMPYFVNSGDGKHQLRGVIVMRMDLKPVMARLGDLETRILIIAIIIMSVISITLILLVRKFILHPISLLTSAVKSMATGNEDIRVNISNSDELGQLGKAFNEMTRDLKASRKSHLISEQNLEEAQKIGGLGHWTWDIPENNLYWSDEIYRIFELNVNSQIPSNELFNQLVHPDDRALVKGFYETAFNDKKPCDFDHRLLMKDGRIKYVNEKLRIEIDATGKPRRSFGIILDISEQKEAEALLIKAKEEADQANKAKTEFIANMSHEIRTPMTSIIGISELLLEKQRDEKEKSYIEHLMKSTHLLLSLINDIIDISNLETGRLKLKEVDFNIKEEMENILDIFLPKTNEKDLKLDYHITPAMPLRLRGDLIRLRQVIINITGNAIKFTEKGKIELSIECAKSVPQDGLFPVLFSIRDTGIGIAEEKLETIFEQFSQVDGSSTRLYGGLGLGLSIVKRLIELMGGEICVESKVKEGTVFHIKIPLKVAM